METDRLAQFEASRRLLFGLAYRLLGEAAEAEDVLQDAYLRWAKSQGVAVAEAWLIKVVTNLCLNRLTSARVRRERYVGPWLPEPVFTTSDSLGPLETVEQRDSVSIGLLVLLERLTPPERAVFVLREAFGYRHAEIAEILDVSAENSRQLHRRAHLHIGEQRKRFDTDGAQRTRILKRFLAATRHSDLARLEQLLTEDVVVWADGGGTTAARVTVAVAEINGGPAAVFRFRGVLVAVTALDSVDGRIITLRTVINPDKLAFAAAQPV